MKKLIVISIAAAMLLIACAAPANAEQSEQKESPTMTYTMPAEDLPHEGTWLTWPHRYTYGMEYHEEIEDIWVRTATALISIIT